MWSVVVSFCCSLFCNSVRLSDWLRSVPAVLQDSHIWSHAVINFTKMVYHTDGRPKLGTSGDALAMNLFGAILLAGPGRLLASDPTWENGLPVQLSSGTWPAKRFRQHLAKPFKNKAFLPVFSTAPIEDAKPNSDLTLAVIWIHGLGADANKYFTDGVSVAKSTSHAASTLTIAPWFGETVVNGSFWHAGSLSSSLTSVFWYGDVSYSHWLLGGYCSSDVPGGPYTSFYIMDELVSTLQGTAFPNLKLVTIAGFSAGCQMSSRWAFFSDTLLPSTGDAAQVQVIASDCSSYMYLDTTRPADSCNAKKDTGTSHTCSDFAVPTWTRRRYYNNYKYGLRDAASDVPYNDTQITKFTTEFQTKTVRFIFGEQDVCSCQDPEYTNPDLCFHSTLSCSPVNGSNSTCCDTYPDTETENVFDSSDAGLVQGRNRLQRGLNYVNHLRVFYRSDSFPKYGFFDGGHDSLAFGSSSVFLKWAFKAKVKAKVEALSILGMFRDSFV